MGRIATGLVVSVVVMISQKMNGYVGVGMKNTSLGISPGQELRDLLQ